MEQCEWQPRQRAAPSYPTSLATRQQRKGEVVGSARDQSNTAIMMCLRVCCAHDNLCPQARTRCQSQLDRGQISAAARRARGGLSRGIHSYSSTRTAITNIARVSQIASARVIP